MSSQLLDVYAAFAAATVEAGGKTIAAKGLGEMPNSVPASDLPIRIQLPFGRRSGTEIVELPIQGYGKGQWRITELMLWKPVAQGEGPAVVSVALTEFKVAYTDMVRGLDLPDVDDEAISEAIRIQFLADVIEWPGQGGTPYWGVECITTVEEFLLDD